VTEPARILPVRRPPAVEEVLDAIREEAAQLRVDAYLVGGFVRDRLLGRGPRKDIDLVVVGEGGVELLAGVARGFGWSRPQQFEHVGTAQVRGDGFVLEVVRARVERYDPESRTPAVRPGTLDEDIWRRDFTVNTLAQTLDGTVLDLTGRGLSDLRDGILRTPLAAADTFGEDPLRMFRAARFAAQLGFSLADGVLEAMREQAPRAAILSVERISEELRHLLVSPHPSTGVEIMAQGGLLATVLPEVEAMIGVEQSGWHRYDVFRHTLLALDHSPPELITRLAVLLHDVGKPPTHAVAADGRHTFHDHPQVGAAMAEAILTRLRFSNEEIRAVCALVRMHLRPIQYDAATFGDRAVLRLLRDAGPLRERLLDVARADTMASAYPDTAGIDELAERMRHLDPGGQVSSAVSLSPLDGDEIMRVFGLASGPQVGRAKDALEKAVLEGEVQMGDKEGAERWLRERLHIMD